MTERGWGELGCMVRLGISFRRIVSRPLLHPNTEYFGWGIGMVGREKGSLHRHSRSPSLYLPDGLQQEINQHLIDKMSI